MEYPESEAGAVRDERNRTCGQHPTLGNVAATGTVRACGRLLPVVDLYRCADCNTAFCRECIRRHFQDSRPEVEAAAFEYTKQVEGDFFDVAADSREEA